MQYFRHLFSALLLSPVLLAAAQDPSSAGPASTEVESTTLIASSTKAEASSKVDTTSSSITSSETTEHADATLAPPTTKASTTSVGNEDDSGILKCDESKQTRGPFCSPEDGQLWYVGGHYEVTWNKDTWGSNVTDVYIQLKYKDFGGNGKVAETWQMKSDVGFIDIVPNADWRINQTVIDLGFDDVLTENQTMYFEISSDAHTVMKSGNRYAGPTILLSSRPAPPTVDPSKRPNPSFLGLAIGLPLMAVFILTMVCGTHFCMRRERQVGPLSIGGGRRHFQKRPGYSGRSARRAKMAAGGNNVYTDEPGSAGSNAADFELASVKGGR